MRFHTLGLVLYRMYEQFWYKLSQVVIVIAPARSRLVYS